MAKLQEEAGKAYASELSSTTDPKRRAFLMGKAAQAKEAAAFHRETAERLRRNDR